MFRFNRHACDGDFHGKPDNADDENGMLHRTVDDGLLLLSSYSAVTFSETTGT